MSDNFSQNSLISFSQFAKRTQQASLPNNSIIPAYQVDSLQRSCSQAGEHLGEASHQKQSLDYSRSTHLQDIKSLNLIEKLSTIVDYLKFTAPEKNLETFLIECAIQDLSSNTHFPSSAHVKDLEDKFDFIYKASLNDVKFNPARVMANQVFGWDWNWINQLNLDYEKLLHEPCSIPLPPVLQFGLGAWNKFKRTRYGVDFTEYSRLLEDLKARLHKCRWVVGIHPVGSYRRKMFV